MIPPAQKKNITIICAGTRAFRTFLQGLGKECPGTWIYCGPDIILENSVSERLGRTWKKIRIGEALQKNAKLVRSQMVEYIGVLSAGRRDDCWWLTTLSEKSPSSSHLFLHLCLLKLGIEISREVDGPFLIVCESRALAESFRANLSNNPNYTVAFCDSRADFMRHLLADGIRTVSEKTWFLARYTGRIFLARAGSLVRKRDPNTRPSGGCTVIHSWADARSIASPGAYHDVYFGDLGERLTRKGISVYYLLDVIPTIWFPRLVYSVLKNNVRFFLLEDFITWPELFTGIHKVWDLPSQIADIPLFGGLDISRVIRAELHNERKTSIGEHAFLCYCACKRMGRELAIKNFIFTYENQACQKFFAYAIRKFSPETTSIGYVHTYAIPMYTLYSVSEKEKDLMPLPDKIIVNGEQSKKYLVACGYPEDRVFIGGALRYTYLASETAASPEKKDKFTVFAAASVNINEAVELIEKCLEAFSGRLEFTIIIKLHPTLPFAIISKNFPSFPENFVVSETPVHDLLKRSDLVLYTSSTVAIEAVALGIPVIHVKSDHVIDMNFFDGESSIPSFSDPKEITLSAEKILISRERMSRSESERLVKKYFLPVDDAVIMLFNEQK